MWLLLQLLLPNLLPEEPKREKVHQVVTVDSVLSGFFNGLFRLYD
jgi:hypothetical protein